MKRGFFERLFPPPDYLAMPAVGVDLSDRSLKYCWQFKTFGEVAIPAGLIENGRIKNKSALTDVLREAAKKFGSKYVVVALPEEPAFTFPLSLPPASRGELRQAIELQLEEHIPLPAEGVVFDYEIFQEPKDGNDSFQIVVSAFPKNLAEEYFQVFTDAGLVVTAFDSETQAMSRALFRASDKGVRLVIDLGRTRTSFFVVVDGLCVLASTVNDLGGDFLSQAIAKNLGVDIKAAEELKNKRGLLQDQDKTLFEALLPAVSVMRDEVNRFLAYWEAEMEKNPKLSAIASAVLCGGQAVMPGLAEYLSASLNFKFEIGDVWVNIMDSKTAKPPLPFDQALRNAATLGLVLRQTSNK